MTKEEFLLLLDELIEEAPGTLQGEEKLDEVDGWDSLASLGFIALVDEHFDLVVSPDKLGQCRTVGDLMLLIGDHIAT